MSAIDQPQSITRNTRLYQPSYLDRFMRFMQHLPVSYWLIYLVLFILQSTLNHIISWSEGWLPLFAFNRILLLYPAWLWLPLAIMTFLNNTSLTAIQSFRPLLDLDDEAVTRLKAEFTTMPVRSVIITSLFWAFISLIVTILYQEAYRRSGIGRITEFVTIIEGLLCFSIGGVMYYHSLRQLGLIHRTVKQVKQFNLFALDPAYAFSRLTARTGISWVIMLGLNFLLFPFQLAPGIIILYALIMLLFAVTAFVLPLRVVNQKLVLEKRAYLADHQRRVEHTLARLHLHLDQGELTELKNLDTALTGLSKEREILEAIPTWPWRISTLTGFLSAAILPVILMMIQIVIERWFPR